MGVRLFCCFGLDFAFTEFCVLVCLLYLFWWYCYCRVVLLASTLLCGMVYVVRVWVGL